MRQVFPAGALAGDLISAACAFLLTYRIRFAELMHKLPMGQLVAAWFRESLVPPWAREEVLVLGYLCAGTALFLYLFDLYDERRLLRKFYRAVSVAKALTVFVIATAFLLFFFKAVHFPRTILFGFWFLSLLFISSERYMLAALREFLRTRFGIDVRRTLIIGRNRLARLLAAEMQSLRGHGYEVIGFLEESKSEARAPEAEGETEELVPVMGSEDDLEEITLRESASAVFIASPGKSSGELMDLVIRSGRLGLETRVLGSVFSVLAVRVALPLDAIRGIPLVDFGPARPGSLSRFLKRALDLALASAALALTLPLWAVVALFIKLEGSGPVFFKQKRLTAGERPFHCLKFRSMYPGAQERLAELVGSNEKRLPIFKMRDDPRVTRVGRIIRRRSIDELPQLVNVLKGEMSLVGPRPPLPQEVPHYESWHRERFKGPAGMTGLWQVSGRSELDFDEMVMLDIYYLRNASLSFDLRILARTLVAVFFAKGAY